MRDCTKDLLAVLSVGAVSAAVAGQLGLSDILEGALLPKQPNVTNVSSSLPVIDKAEAHRAEYSGHAFTSVGNEPSIWRGVKIPEFPRKESNEARDLRTPKTEAED